MNRELESKGTQDIVVYESSDGEVSFNVNVFEETVWLNTNDMSYLFSRDVKTLRKHINNIFKENELEKNSVVSKFATTAADGKKYQVEYYNWF